VPSETGDLDRHHAAAGHVGRVEAPGFLTPPTAAFHQGPLVLESEPTGQEDRTRGDDLGLTGEQPGQR